MRNFRIISRLELKSLNIIKGMMMEGLRKMSKFLPLVKNYSQKNFDEFYLEDIVASLYDRKIDLGLIRKFSSIKNVPLTVSGRVKNLKDFHNLFRSGADKIAVNTYAVENPEIFKKASRVFGSQSIVCHIQYKQINNNIEIFTESGRKKTRINLFDWINKIQEFGVGEIFVNSIDNDGVVSPINYDILHRLRELSSVPLCDGGGGRNQNIIEKIIEIGFDAVTLSSAIHYDLIDVNQTKIDLSKKFKNVNFNIL